MDKKQIVLCDTNILIEFYKGNKKIIDDLKKIGQDNIAISIITTGELMYGALNKTELIKIKKDCESLKILDIDVNISSCFIQIMTIYSLSHKITLPDALIAATALNNNIELFTLNIKDFKFISGLKLYK